MVQYHAVMIDETGCEFGVSLEAESLDDAWDQLREDYPESYVDVVKTSDQWDQDRRDREARMWAGDDDGYDRYDYDY